MNQNKTLDSYAKDYEREFSFDHDVTPVDVQIDDLFEVDLEEEAPLTWTTKELLEHNDRQKQIKRQQVVTTACVCLVAVAAFAVAMAVFGMMVY